MNKEHSAGCILFTQSKQYVIIESLNGEYGFPKGHLEENETPEQAAIRETHEEVGLTVELIDDFSESIEYLISEDSGQSKMVTFFLAECTNKEIRIQKEEVASAQFLTYEEALATLTFENTKNILKKSHHFLSNPSSNRI